MQQLSASSLGTDITATVIPLTAADIYGSIVGATDVGAVNGGADPDNSLEYVEVGSSGTANTVDDGEIIVYIA